MKKLILMMLVLVCGVGQMKADPVLKGSFDNWGSGKTFDNDNGTFTCYLSLYDVNNNIEFKIYDTTTGNWLGSSLNITAPAGWVTEVEGDGNCILNSSGNTITYDVLKLTAYWSEGWYLTFEGCEKQSYTVSFVNGQNWDNVYGYIFDEYGNSGWTSNLLSTTSTITVDGVNYDVYSYTFEREFTPKVIFHNGVSQTGDLDVVNNKLYLLALPTHYAVVGDNTTLFGETWDGNGAKGTTTFMTLNDGIYSFTVNKVELSANTEIKYKVVKRVYNLGNDGKIYDHIVTWYPDGVDPTCTIPADGVYDVKFTFDTSNSSVSATADRFNVSVSFGELSSFATFSSEYAVDFESVSTVNAYRAEMDGNRVKLVGITKAKDDKKVPANTGLILNGTPNQSYSIETTICTSNEYLSGNLLKPGTGAEVNSDAQYSRYSFVKRGNDYGFVKIESPKTIAKGKAYLEVPATSAASFDFYFDDEPTAIYSINANDNSVENGAVYNLAGQRVAEPSKGLYIVNGKKYIK